ncbi:hypothetical protein GCM10027605_63730 [Micromonospora zhanjiangensis]
MPSNVGSQPTSSFEPIVGSTPYPSPPVPQVRATQAEIAERNPAEPAVSG